jgi:hypothetical protein
MLWTLWVALILTLPVPYWAIEVGLVPTASLLALALVTLGASIFEGGDVLPLLALVLTAQAVAWTGILFVAARGVTRRIGRRRSILTQRALATVLVCGLAAMALFDVYRAPFSTSGPRTNVLGAFW